MITESNLDNFIEFFRKGKSMRLSRSTDYALKAVAFIKKNEGAGIVLSASISAEYDIPLEYLLKILQQLVRAGLLLSKRGPRGGFSLAKKKITILEVIEGIEGKTPPAEISKDLKVIETTYDKAVEAFRYQLNKVTF